MQAEAHFIAGSENIFYAVFHGAERKIIFAVDMSENDFFNTVFRKQPSKRSIRRLDAERRIMNHHYHPVALFADFFNLFKTEFKALGFP